MKNTFSLGLRVGFLGGGQLARMMVLKAHEMGLEPHVLCPSVKEPAAQVTSRWHRGDPHSAADVLAFSNQVDLLTIESEFIPGNTLATLKDLPIWPRPEHVILWQDRAQQKKMLVQNNLHTANFTVIKNHQQAELFFERNPAGIVFKKNHGGYDGYGTFMARNKNEHKKCLNELDFSKETFIAEAFIPFRRELAFVVARNLQNDFVSLPLVQTHQEDRRLDWLMGPIKQPQIVPLLGKIKRMLTKMNYVGTMAFELFEDQTGKLLINEIAPRVHNSAHYSLEALAIDQFTLHLMAIVNLKLNSADLLAPKFAMVNLIGTGNQVLPPLQAHSTGTHVHWYGKKENRQGRKMGHITWIGRSSPKLGLKLLQKERKGFQK